MELGGIMRVVGGSCEVSNRLPTVCPPCVDSSQTLQDGTSFGLAQ